MALSDQPRIGDTVIPPIQTPFSAPNASASPATNEITALGIIKKNDRVLSNFLLPPMGLKMSEKMVRVSFTVPPQIRSDLDYLCGRLHVTKSALISELLAGPLSDLRELTEMVPDNPSQADFLRAKGKSNALIAKRLRSYRAIEGDLFDDRPH